MGRDLEKDLKICEAATPGPWSKVELISSLYEVYEVWQSVDNSGIARLIDNVSSEVNARFIAEARTGWPQTIRYAMKLEEEIGRLREENAMLLEQLNQRGCRV